MPLNVPWIIITHWLLWLSTETGRHMLCGDNAPPFYFSSSLMGFTLKNPFRAIKQKRPKKGSRSSVTGNSVQCVPIGHSVKSIFNNKTNYRKVVYLLQLIEWQLKFDRLYIYSEKWHEWWHSMSAIETSPVIAHQQQNWMKFLITVQAPGRVYWQTIVIGGLVFLRNFCCANKGEKEEWIDRQTDRQAYNSGNGDFRELI